MERISGKNAAKLLENLTLHLQFQLGQTAGGIIQQTFYINQIGVDALQNADDVATRGNAANVFIADMVAKRQGVVDDLFF